MMTEINKLVERIRLCKTDDEAMAIAAELIAAGKRAMFARLMQHAKADGVLGEWEVPAAPFLGGVAISVTERAVSLSHP
jgi:hypothetical protein